MGFFTKQKKTPFKGIPINDEGVDLYSLVVGDFVRVCLSNPNKGALPFHHLIYLGYRFGRDYFLANFQKRITEYSAKREDLGVQTNLLDSFFMVMDKTCRRELEFNKKEGSKGYRKRNILIRTAYSLRG